MQNEANTPQLQAQEAIVPPVKRRGARATGTESQQINARLIELCAQGMCGRDIVVALNREFRRNFTPFAYYHRADKLGLDVTRGRPRPSSHRESVPEELREACLQDPAWEARNKIADWTACRECFRFYKGGLYSHVKREHGGLAEYRRFHPGARVFSFEHVAKDTGSDCQKLMCDFAESYATPEERAKAATDPDYYKNIAAYRVCCVGRCGLKAADLGHHLRDVHGMSARDYWIKYGQLPITSEAVLAKKREEAAAQRTTIAKAESILSNIGRNAEDEVWTRTDELYNEDLKWSAIKDLLDLEFGFERTVKAYQEGRKRYLARQKPTK